MRWKIVNVLHFKNGCAEEFVLKILMGHVRTLSREVHGSKKGGKSFVNFSARFHTHQATYHL